MKPGKQLYQWDVNQFLIELQPTAEFVDYPMGNEVIRIKSDGTRCRIPDEVLQTYGGKTCYERYTDGTYRAYSFTVLYSPKPPDYVFTPEERTTFEALTARVDAAIEEIKRRADSGEFTPVKGVDYFTDAEKNEMMESVSTGAIGEFRKVVDTATTEYNDNHNLKLDKYNANAADKLTTYDTNAEQHTTDYNRNAAEKLEAYNQNHTAKVAEYNQNAETKTAEFDANAAALQTEVDRLRGECDTLAAENRKQENRISALMKLNKGQTYDILPEEGETASRTAPSGAKYVSVDKVGGHSEVVDGEIISSQTDRVDVKGKNLFDNSSMLDGYYDSSTGKFIANSATKATSKFKSNPSKNYILSVNEKSISGYLYEWRGDDYIGRKLIPRTGVFTTSAETTLIAIALYDASASSIPVGALIQLEEGSVVTEYSPYSLQKIPTNFPVLKSAGSVYDYIDMDGGQVIRNVYTVELETLQWKKNADNRFVANLPAQEKAAGTYNDKNNELCNTYESKTLNEIFAGEKGIATHPTTGETVWIFDSAYETPEQLVASLAGAVLHYELETPITEPVTIPEALQEWLPVEPGGTVTFRNADESKQLPVPNVVSWVRKLDEVN